MTAILPWKQRNGTAPDPAYLIREPAEVYLAKSNDYLTSHGLASFRESPLLYRRKQLGLVPDEDSGDLVIGRATHALVLEGREEYERRFAVGGPINPRTSNVYGPKTKAYQKWAQALGRPVLTDSQAAQVEAMYASVQAHKLAMSLLAEGQAEAVIRSDYRGISCQARPDWLLPGKRFIDLKTCNNIGEFQGKVKSLGYFHQLAFYRSLLSHITGDLLAAYLIVVERHEPFRCGVWRVDPDVLLAAQRENEEAMARLGECRRLDCWPTGYESERVFDRF